MKLIDNPNYEKFQYTIYSPKAKNARTQKQKSYETMTIKV
jgi:hypothetical protein